MNGLKVNLPKYVFYCNSQSCNVLNRANDCGICLSEKARTLVPCNIVPSYLIEAPLG